MPAILDTLANEPIAVVAVIDALLGLAIGFGAPVDPKIAALIDAAVIAVLALYARSKVTPNAKVAPSGQNIVVPVPAPPTPPAA